MYLAITGINKELEEHWAMGWLRPTMFSFMIVCGLYPGVGGKCLFASFNFFQILPNLPLSNFAVLYNVINVIDMVM